MLTTTTRSLLTLACAGLLVACSAAETADSAQEGEDVGGLFGDAAPVDTVAAPADGDSSSSQADASAVPDVGPSTHGFGWPCVSDEECHSGYCLQPDDGDTGFCSQLCQQDCPDGYLCQNQPKFGPVVLLCVPLEKISRAMAGSASC